MVLIIGELINTSRKHIREAVENKNSDFIREIARKQEETGAHYIDVNCGTIIENEPEIMQWLVRNVQEVVSVPLSIDTPNPAAMEAGLVLLSKSPAFVNSITAENKCYDTLLPLVLKYKTKVIALCMDDKGIPANADGRIQIVRWLVDHLTAAGVSKEDIYVDPLITPISTGDKAGWEVLKTIRFIHKEYPEVHTICGLSNISYGLPNRRVLNQTFMIQTMVAGMDAYILDPTDQEMMGFVYASQALLGQDSYCGEYLKAHRKGLYK
jgi:5-methyltetrahydrofolate--homocysteine methyltransferase